MPAVAFSPLAQGMLTDKYLGGIPRARAQHKSLSPSLLSDEAQSHVRALNEIARRRGQSLAHMALAWALRDGRATSVLVAASSAAQLEQNIGALDNLSFDGDELALIDEHAVDANIDLWAKSREV